MQESNMNMVDNPLFNKELIKKYKLKRINSQPICSKCSLNMADCSRYCYHVAMQKKKK